MSAFDPQGLDDVIHGKLRLAVMSYLSAVDDAGFTELRERTGASDGNLSVQLRKLEEAGYVSQTKQFVNRRPHTRVRLTPAGRAAWIAYLDALRGLIGQTAASE
ncbi:MAG: transcriptional regulator [Oceanicaulis sp.]|nr:transcriptional regulator [Oceanicaulis sp.]